MSHSAFRSYRWALVAGYASCRTPLDVNLRAGQLRAVGGRDNSRTPTDATVSVSTDGGSDSRCWPTWLGRLELSCDRSESRHVVRIPSCLRLQYAMTAVQSAAASRPRPITSGATAKTVGSKTSTEPYGGAGWSENGSYSTTTDGLTTTGTISQSDAPRHSTATSA